MQVTSDETDAKSSSKSYPHATQRGAELWEALGGFRSAAQ